MAIVMGLKALPDRVYASFEYKSIRIIQFVAPQDIRAF